MKAPNQPITGHDLLAVERFRDDTRHMAEFYILADCPLGHEGQYLRRFLNEDGYAQVLDAQRQGHVRVHKHAAVIEGHIIPPNPSGGGANNQEGFPTYNVNSLEYVIDRLFRCGIGDPGYKEREVEELLEGMDYNSLLQAVRHEAKTVHAFATYGKPPQTFDYRGADLFGQRATLLYDDFDQGDAAQVLAERRYELWLLEDMSLVVVSCVSVDFGDGEFVTEYREIKQGDPWNTPMCLNLEELAENLFEMFGQCYEHTLPVYEL